MKSKIQMRRLNSSEGHGQFVRGCARLSGVRTSASGWIDFTSINVGDFGGYQSSACSIDFFCTLKACFSNKKYPITFQTRPTQIVKVYFWLKNRYLKIIGAQNQLPITFRSDLVCNKAFEIWPHTHESLTFNILIFLLS